MLLSSMQNQSRCLACVFVSRAGLQGTSLSHVVYKHCPQFTSCGRITSAVTTNYSLWPQLSSISPSLTRCYCNMDVDVVIPVHDAVVSCPIISIYWILEVWIFTGLTIWLDYDSTVNDLKAKQFSTAMHLSLWHPRCSILLHMATFHHFSMISNCCLAEATLSVALI